MSSEWNVIEFQFSIKRKSLVTDLDRCLLNSVPVQIRAARPPQVFRALFDGLAAHEGESRISEPHISRSIADNYRLSITPGTITRQRSIAPRGRRAYTRARTAARCRVERSPEVGRKEPRFHSFLFSPGDNDTPNLATAIPI